MLVLLAGVTLLGFFLRLHGISASADYEEYVCLAHLDASGIGDFLHQMRGEDPYIAPLPFVIIYAWSRLAGHSPAAVRFLFVLLGTATIALLYHAGTLLLSDKKQGRRIGLIAACCVALSPVHAFHAQEVRHTTLLAFLGLCSMICFLRASQDDQRRWWAGNMLFNMCMVWTHLLGGALLLVQGLCLLLTHTRRIRLIAAWTGLQALLLLPWLAWLWSIPARNSDPAVVFPVWDFLLRIASTDFVFFPHNLFEGRYPWESVMNGLIALRAPARGLWVAGAYIAGAALLCRAMRTTRNGAPNASTVMLLLAWFAVPPFVLYLLLYAGMPAYAHRYFLYSTFALYFLFGMAITATRHALLRGLLVALLLSLCVYNTALSLLSPHRTQWSAAISLLDSCRKTEEPLVLTGFCRTMCRFNGATFQDGVVVQDGTTSLWDALKNAADQTKQPVWAIRNLASADDMNLDFEAGLQARGLEGTLFPFPGERWLEVWFVETPFSSPAPGEQERRRNLYWQALKVNPKSPNAFSKLDRLRVQAGLDALSLWEKAEGERPCSAWTQFYLGQALETKRRQGEAIAAYRRATRLDARHSEFFNRLMALLVERQDVDGAIAACRAGQARPPFAARTALMLLGAILEDTQRWEEAAKAYREAIATEPRARKAWMRYDAVLVRSVTPEKRITLWRELNASYPGAVWPSFILGEALEDNGQDPEALDLLGQASGAVPANYEMADRFARCLLKNDDVQRALTAWHGCMPMSTDQSARAAAALCEAGDRQVSKENWRKAIDAFRAASEFGPDNGHYWMRLGEVLERAADMEAAANAYRRAASCSPAPEEAGHALAALCARYPGLKCDNVAKQP